MQRLGCIVAATDFTPAGDAAVHRAFSLCTAGTRLVLSHVIDVAPAPNPLYAHYAVGHVPSVEQLEQMGREATQALEALVPPEARSEGIDVQIDVRAGPVVETLCQLAEAVDAEVIVVADSGRGVLSRALLGSVTDRLVHLAPCSVLVTRTQQR